MKWNWLNVVGLLVVLYGLFADTTPGPGPNPPTPTPTGFKAILVMGTDKASLDAIAVVDSAEVRDYLDAKCVDGKGGWHRWYKDTDASNYGNEWKDIWAKAKPMVSYTPAVVIVEKPANVIKIKPWPGDKAALLALLKQYGG